MALYAFDARASDTESLHALPFILYVPSMSLGKLAALFIFSGGSLVEGEPSDGAARLLIRAKSRRTARMNNLASMIYAAAGGTSDRIEVYPEATTCPAASSAAREARF